MQTDIMHSLCPACVRAAPPNDGVVQSESFRAASRARSHRGVSTRPRNGVASCTNSPRVRLLRLGGQGGQQGGLAISSDARSEARRGTACMHSRRELRLGCCNERRAGRKHRFWMGEV